MCSFEAYLDWASAAVDRMNDDVHRHRSRIAATGVIWLCFPEVCQAQVQCQLGTPSSKGDADVLLQGILDLCSARSPPCRELNNDSFIATEVLE